MIGRYRASRINVVQNGGDDGTDDSWSNQKNDTNNDYQRGGGSLRDVVGAATGTTKKGERHYQALSDDDEAGSESSGESLGIQIPHGYLSSCMSSSFEASSPRKKRPKNENGSTMLANLSGSASPRAEQNSEDLLRLVALAKHPNPEAAERAIQRSASSSSGPALEGRKRRSSKKHRTSADGVQTKIHTDTTTRSNKSKGSNSPSSPSSSNGSTQEEGVNVSLESGNSWSSADDNMSSGSCSSTDDSQVLMMEGGQLNSPSSLTTFAANLGSRPTQAMQLRPSVTYSTEEEEKSEDDSEKTSHPKVSWDDDGRHYHSSSQQGRMMDREMPPPPVASPAQRRHQGGGVMEWMSVLFTPASQADSGQNPTDSSLASKEQSVGISVSSEKTPKISNVSPENWKKGQQEFEFDEKYENSRCKRFLAKRSTFAIVILCVIIFVALVTAIAAAMYSSRRGGGGSTNSSKIPSREDDVGTMIPRPPTPPTIAPATTPPTKAPITSTATGTSIPQAPSGTSTPTTSPVAYTSNPTAQTLRPTLSPTQGIIKDVVLVTPPTTPSPTTSASLYPSVVPTIRVPTVSPSHSMLPTVPPTTSFYGSNLTPLGDIQLEGAESGERYGYAVAVSDDGKIMVVASPYANVQGKYRAGMVQVYELRGGSSWVTRGRALLGRNVEDQFGSTLAISSDGQVLAIAEPTYHGPAGDRSGGVRIFRYSAVSIGYELMGQELHGEAATDHFGVALTLSGDGNRLAVGAPYHDNGGENRNVSGNVQVYQFQHQLNRWDPLGRPLVGVSHLDWFGWSLDFTHDGNALAVGAPRNLEYGGYVRCYQFDESSNDWERLGAFDINNSISPTRYDDSFGHSIAITAISISNQGFKTYRLAIGCPGKNAGALNSGVVAVYQLTTSGHGNGASSMTNRWALVGSAIEPAIPGNGHQFGYSVDLEGDVLAVGIPGWADNRGKVDLYNFSSNRDNDSGIRMDWRLHPTLDPTMLEGLDKSDFGFSVRLVSSPPQLPESSWTLVVGSADTSNDLPGRVHAFKVL